MKRCLLAVGLLALVGEWATAMAAVIAVYDLPPTASGYTSVAPSSVAAGVTASPLSINGSVTGSSFGQHFYYSGWDASVNLAKYYEATFTVALGQALTLDDVTYSVENTGGTTTFQVRSSLDGFTSVIDSFSITNADVTNHTTDLSGLGPITGSVTFRFYATASSPGVTMGFANHQPGGTGGGLPDVGQDVTFNGTVAPAAIPEPSSLALFGLTALASAGCCWRRRKQAVKD